MPDKPYNIDAYISFLSSPLHSVDAFINFLLNSKTHSIDAYVGPTTQVKSVNLAGSIIFKIAPTAYVQLNGTIAQPVRNHIKLIATIRGSGIKGINLAGTVIAKTRSYTQLRGTIQVNPNTNRAVNVDAYVVSTPLGFVNLAAQIIQKVTRGYCGSYPDASYINLSAWIVNPSPDSIQVPNQGFTRSDDWLSSQDALASYKATSIFKILGSTLPTAGLGLIVTGFTAGVVSFQTRTRSWLRRVDAAPNGVLISTQVNTHTLPNGVVITTTTQTRQQQDTTTTTVTVVSSATPTRFSTIVTEKTAGGQTTTREIDTNLTNGILISTEKKTVFAIAPTTDNIQPLAVKTLDGVIHYQFFDGVNPEWAGGEQEGVTTTKSTKQITPTPNGFFNEITDSTVSTPDGKSIETHIETIGTNRTYGAITTDTSSIYQGLQKITKSVTTYPDGSQEIKIKDENTTTGDSTETTTENVTDEYGQTTTTVTTAETKTFVDAITGQTRQTITKTVAITKSGVTTTDVTVVTDNNFEDDIINQKIRVYFIQEFTITCVCDEFSMLALSEINITHQRNYALLELFGQQLGNANLSYPLRQKLITQFNQANACISPVTLQALGRIYKVVFAQSASGFRAKYIPGTEPHAYELQIILQVRSDLATGTFGA